MVRVEHLDDYTSDSALLQHPRCSVEHGELVSLDVDLDDVGIVEVSGVEVVVERHGRNVNDGLASRVILDRVGAEVELHASTRSARRTLVDPNTYMRIQRLIDAELPNSVWMRLEGVNR